MERVVNVDRWRLCRKQRHELGVQPLFVTGDEGTADEAAMDPSCKVPGTTDVPRGGGAASDPRGMEEGCFLKAGRKALFRAVALALKREGEASREDFTKVLPDASELDPRAVDGAVQEPRDGRPS